MAKGFMPPRGGGNQLQQLLQQAQKAQREMEQAEAHLAEQTYTATAGGNAVRVTLGGDRLLRDVQIDPQAATPDDVEMLQDLVLAAVNEALRTADDARQQALSKVAGGMTGLR